MRCPRLQDLPPPPSGRVGWPWTEETPSLPDVMADGEPWPKISIVTPSYNQGEYIEETIRSVLLQGYPNLEYIIIDGKSKDSTLSKLKAYSEWITFWISEKDDGQAHAINKGFQRSSGEVQAYINSDDLYCKGILHEVASEYIVIEDKKQFFIAYPVEHFGAIDSFVSIPYIPTRFVEILKGNVSFWQPGAFWAKSLFERQNMFDQSYKYSFDTDFFLKNILQEVTLHERTGLIAARFRYHNASKTVKNINLSYVDDGFVVERKAIRMKYKAFVSRSDRKELIAFLRQHAMSHAATEAKQHKSRIDSLVHFVRGSSMYPSSSLTRFFWGTIKGVIFKKKGLC